jgi:hypothetical protein
VVSSRQAFRLQFCMHVFAIRATCPEDRIVLDLNTLVVFNGVQIIKVFITPNLYTSLNILLMKHQKERWVEYVAQWEKP